MLKRFFNIEFGLWECNFGSFETKYSDIDAYQNRPIHKDMSVAPPWATRNITITLFGLTFRVNSDM